MHLHAKSEFLVGSDLLQIMIVTSINDMKTVKGYVVKNVIAGGGCVVTVATTEHAMTMMFAVKNMATSTGDVSLHLMYSCVIHCSTVKLIYSS